MSAKQLLAVLAAVPIESAVPPDASLLRTGVFTYRDLQGHEMLGHDRLTVMQQADGSYSYSDVSIGYADQKWTAVASSDFTPIAAKLAMGSGPEQRTLFEIRYRAGRVDGVRFERQSNNGIPTPIRPTSLAE